MSHWLRSMTRPCRGHVLLMGSWLLMAPSCGDEPEAGDDPRARGPSAFTSTLPEVSGTGNAGGPGPNIPREYPGYTPAGSITRVVDSTLVTLNEYRGLHVLDVTGSRPEPLSRVPMPGRPMGLFLDGDLAIAVIADAEVTRDCAGCPPDGRMSGSRVHLTNLADRRAPVALPPIEVAGTVIAARLRGKTLDLVSRGPAQAMPPGGVSEPATLIRSLDLSNPARPGIVRDLVIPGPEWTDAVHFAGDTVYLALYGSRRWVAGACTDAPPIGAPGSTLPQGCSRIAAVDLTAAPAKIAASVELRGRVATSGLDRFAEVLSVLLQGSSELSKAPAEERPPVLVTIRASVPTELTAIGELALPAGRNGSPPRFRFDAGRLFLATDDPSTPLIVVAAAPDTPPVISHRLPAGSLVNEISHLSADRLLVTEMQVRDGQCPQRGLSLFSVNATSQPTLLARTVLPFEADGNVTVLDGGLVVQAGRSTDVIDGAMTTAVALRLFQLDGTGGSLTALGTTSLSGDSLNTVLSAGPGKLVTVSSDRAETVDVADRSNPRTGGHLDLARWVQDVQFAGGHAVTLINDSTRARGFLHLSPANDPDASRPLVTWPLEGQVGRLFANDRFVYLFWHASRRVGRADPRLDVFEVVEGNLRHRSSRSLDGPASLALAPENDGDGPVGQGLRQVAGTTFVATLSRVRDCSSSGNITGGSSSPGRAGSCAPAALPPLTQLPPAQAIQEAPGVAELRQRLDKACPGSGADLMVIDVGDPDQPRITSLVQLPGTGDLGTSVVQGKTLFVLQDEVTHSSPVGGPETRSVKHFVHELDIADPTAPRLGPRVNVPGRFLAAHPPTATWFTAEPTIDAEGKPVAVNIVTLYHPSAAARAYEERRLVMTGTASEPVPDGSRLFVTVNDALVALDLTSPGAPLEVSRTPVPGGAPQIHRAVGQHAFVLVGGRAMRVFDMRTPTAPRLLDRIVLTPRGAHQVRLAPGNRAVIPCAESGLEIIDLQDEGARAAAP